MSRWLFFPSPAAAGYLQEITWNMSGYGNASSLSSTGQEIINPDMDFNLSWSSGTPRFWLGSESANAGATSWSSGSTVLYGFSTNAAGRSWWNDYIVEMEFNGGTWDSSSDPIGGNGLSSYLNVAGSQFATTGTAFVSGDTIKFRVSAAS
jgi:hypothetical protein